jgi:hypothetical protein
LGVLISTLASLIHLVRYNTCTPAPCTTLDANKEHACWNIGVIALADGIKDMRTMTSLDLASNDLGAEGAKIVAKAIKVYMCTPAIIMPPFSCPSDF